MNPWRESAVILGEIIEKTIINFLYWTAIQIKDLFGLLSLKIGWIGAIIVFLLLIGFIFGIVLSIIDRISVYKDSKIENG